MADYTTPPWSQLVAGKPWTDEKAAAAFENPIAIAEGADGAPRLRVGALQRLSAGSVVRVRNDAEISGVSLSGIDVAFIQKGNVRITFEHKCDSGIAGAAKVVRTRGGIETQLASYSNTTSYGARSVDCSILPGDAISVTNDNGGIETYVRLRNCRMQTNGEDYFPVTVNAGTPEGNAYA